jgi:hypothetical protein
MSQGMTTIAVLYHPAKTGAAALAHRFAAQIPRIAEAQVSALSLADTVPAALDEATLALVCQHDGRRGVQQGRDKVNSDALSREMTPFSPGHCGPHDPHMPHALRAGVP